MPADWSRDAPDLMIALDRTGAALALQIQEQLRVAIREGRLLAGERLPSTRRLAEHLGVSRGTVVEVYEQLVAEGYVDSAVGSGTRVARIPGAERRDRTEAPAAAAAAADARDRLRVRHPRSRLGSAARLGVGGG